MTHKLPELGFAYDAIEPFIDAMTMEIHYPKHHGGYVNNLNKALEAHSDLQNKSLEELLKNLSSVPQEIQTAVRNNGGGHWNHSFFWALLKRMETISLRVNWPKPLSLRLVLFMNLKNNSTRLV